MHRPVYALLILFLAQPGVVGTVSAQPYAYVSNISGNSISVVNGANLTVTASIPVPAGPTGLAVTPDASAVYVASQTAATVSAISTATNSVVASINVAPTPTHLAIRPNGSQVYVASQGANQITVIDTASHSVIATIPVGVRPAAVAFNPAGTRAFVANAWSGDVSVIDTAAKTVISTFAADNGPSDIAVSPDGRFVYVTNQYAGSVTVHDAASGILIATVGGLASPNSIAVSPNGGRLYVTNGNAGTVSAIDTSSNSVVATIAVGTLPTSVAVSADGARAYVTNEYSFSLSVIDTGSNSVVNTIARVGVYPFGVATAPAATTTPPVTCSISVSPGSTSYGPGGGTGTMNVQAPSGCPWTAGASTTWIQITSGANGTGNGVVTYSVGANGSTAGRSGTLTVAGQKFTISQTGVTCTYTLSSSDASLGAGGGSGSAVVTTPAGCPWSITSDSVWLTINGPSTGTGTGTIGFLAAANTYSTLRTGNLNVAGQVLTVSQAGAAFAAIRVNCGGPAFTDPAGNVWIEDDQRNRTITTAAIANTDKPAIYQTESWATGTLQYHFAVPNGSYSVRLHFAEIYMTQPGQRVFDIVINGTTVHPSFDILAQTVPNTAIVQTFNVSVTGGQLTIQLVPGGGTPKLSGIEIL